MKIHEYQGKDILRQHNVAVPQGAVAFTADEAYEIAEKLGGGVVIVKAQIHAGGRGKGGGVKLAKNPAEAKAIAEKMLGMTLVTHQTGPEGKKVQRILIEEGMDIDRELYVGITLDRAKGKNAIMVSTEGGMEIEEVAEKTPEKIVKEWVSPDIGLQPFQARKLAFAIGLSGKQFKSGVKFLTSLYRAYDKNDCSLAEINPLVVTKDGNVLALDAKMNFDDSSLFRHKDIEELRDPNEEDVAETEARAADLSFIKLDGNVGCVVNGAGLAMATMDLVKHFGGEPANFLDIGGSSNPEKVINALKIIQRDKNVKSILFNIFGGITRCDDVANGIVEAFKKAKPEVPVVVRLTGTNEEEGKKILESVGLTAASSMEDVVKKAIELAG
ncbi:MAG: succinate--CoA ligase subunit beta [Candidatus Cloacimonetes bacterium 4572_55]|nr:MAG: succinate--CoA ligase subunit beta [Candidatus Cloacimonetes bacterium 4572_55]